MAGDKVQIEILEDGTIKMTTDPISAPNHQNAEQFLKTVSRLAGGETSREQRKDTRRFVTRKEGEREHQ